MKKQADTIVAFSHIAIIQFTCVSYIFVKISFIKECCLELYNNLLLQKYITERRKKICQYDIQGKQYQCIILYNISLYISPQVSVEVVRKPFDFASALRISWIASKTFLAV